MNYYRPYPDGSLRCRPGNAVLPRDCSWHHEHYWCYTCEGYYGVPHDGIHEGPSAHPLTNPRKCACRPCVEATARLDDQRRDPNMSVTGLVIEQMYAFVAVDPEDGNEGVMAFRSSMGMTPMVGADMEMMDKLRPMAEALALEQGIGVEVKLVVFSHREEIEVLT